MTGGRKRLGGERSTESGETAEDGVLIFCLVPPELAGKLLDPLERYFSDEPRVEVLTERRSRARRSGEGRRVEDLGPPSGVVDRRKIRNPDGRRVGERRAALVPVDPPKPLPRKYRSFTDHIGVAERFAPPAQELEDQKAARLVTRFQSGEVEPVFMALYNLYFDRVYGYLRTALRDAHEAEDAAQQVFMSMLEALPRYERRSQPFRAWLFVLVRNQAVSRLRKSNRLEVEEPAVIERHREGADLSPEPAVLDWISDQDLMLFVERLPLAQRQVLLLRYSMDFSNRQIAEIMDRTPMDVGRLHYRAVSYLRERLAAVGRKPPRSTRRSESRRPISHVQVLRARRFALTWRA